MFYVVRLTFYVFFFLAVTLSDFRFIEKENSIEMSFLYFSFFIHNLYYFMNIEFICPTGKLIQKTFEIKNLRLRGGVTVWLRYYLFLTFIFCSSKKRNKKRCRQ